MTLIFCVRTAAEGYLRPIPERFSDLVNELRVAVTPDRKLHLLRRLATSAPITGALGSLLSRFMSVSRDPYGKTEGPGATDQKRPRWRFISSDEFSSCQRYYFRMPKIYVVEIISGSSTIRLGDAHLISYKATKLVLRWSAKTSAQLSLIRDHATLQTILTFRLASEGAVSWVSPPFRAQVTSVEEKNLQFELTLLDKVDLSELRAKGS